MAKKLQDARFWMIWNPSGRQPGYKHYDREEANREAERLASENPGQSFYVLKAVGGVKASMPPLQEIKIRRAHDSEIPF